MSVTEIIAIIGSTTTSVGTLYGIWTAYDDRRQKGRSNLKLSVMEDAYVLEGDTSKDYTILNVANRGEHEVSLSTAGATFLDAAGSMIYSPLTFRAGHSAEPHKSLAIFAPIRNSNEPRIAYYWVTTTLGEQFKAYVVPRRLVLWHNLLDWTHIHRKQKVRTGLKFGKKK